MNGKETRPDETARSWRVAEALPLPWRGDRERHAVTVIHSRLENGLWLGEALGFPENILLDDRTSKLNGRLEAVVGALLESTPLARLHARQGPLEGEVEPFELTVAPPRGARFWRHPVTLRLTALRWRLPDGQSALYLPALRVLACGKQGEDLVSVLQADARMALGRLSGDTDLGALAQAGRGVELLADRVLLEIPHRTWTASVWNVEEQQRQQKARRTFEACVDELACPRGAPAIGLDDVVARMAHCLERPNGTSIVLAGPSGVGKSAAWRELHRRRESSGLARLPFWSTSGSRLVSGMQLRGQWEERCDVICKKAAARHAILHVGDLAEFVHAARTGPADRGFLGYMRPWLVRGDFRIVAETTPEQWARLEASDAHLLEPLTRIELPSAAGGQLLDILRQRCHEGAVGQPSPSGRPRLTEEALLRVVTLHDRFARYSGMPGRALRFLEGLEAAPAGGAAEIGVRDVAAAFSRETGLPPLLTDPGVGGCREELIAFLGARVIGQEPAVEAAADAIVAQVTRLARTGKPLASLVFAGPTGVGKTRLAIALAELLFGSREALIRFDMSEFGDSWSVQRLIGHGAGSDGLLTSRVRERPFSVLLLDEFEKADASFQDLLLQVLGEGRLTDGAGRIADFTGHLVVLTTNLGAESFRHRITGFEAGSSPGRTTSRLFSEAVRAAVRPELFNRFDAVLPFLPLEPATVKAIVDGLLEGVRMREGVRTRSLRLEEGPGIAAELAVSGHDPRYGARPLERAVAQQVLAPLARGLCEHPSSQPLAAMLSLAGGRINVVVKKDSSAPAGAGRPLRRGAADIVELRRQAQRLCLSRGYLELLNRAARLKRREHLDAREAELVKRIEGATGRIRAFSDRIDALEDEVLEVLHGVRSPAGSPFEDRLASQGREWLDAALLPLEFDLARPDEVTLAIYSEHSSWLLELYGLYRDVISARDRTLDVAGIVLCRAPGGNRLECRQLNDPRQLPRDWIDRQEGPSDKLVGFVLRIHGPHAHLRYIGEHGEHLRKAKETETKRAVVETQACSAAAFVPPAELLRRGGLPPRPRRRVFRPASLEIDDPVQSKPQHWDSHGLALLIERGLQQRIEASLDR